jgi:hypothetical protein
MAAAILAAMVATSLVVLVYFGADRIFLASPCIYPHFGRAAETTCGWAPFRLPSGPFEVALEVNPTSLPSGSYRDEHILFTVPTQRAKKGMMPEGSRCWHWTC